jgi:UDPglucose 6-dehydrogenase
MITVLGLGFVGLTTALGFAEAGFEVYGYDISEAHRQRLAAGEVPFYEPQLKDMLAKHQGGRFRLVAELGEAVRRSSVVFVCVGTPQAEDGSAHLGYLDAAIAETLGHCEGEGFKVLVVKSTVPPSTAKEHVVPFVGRHGFVVGETIGVASNPEFLREGYAWEDFIRPDRVVIGVSDPRTARVIDDLYRPFGAPVHLVSLNTAEFIKYLSNTLLATMISFANEMSIIADRIGDIEIPAAFRILHQDKRWSGQPASMTSYVFPGCGFGGYCLPKDTAALAAKSAAKGHEAALLETVLTVNEEIKTHHVERIARSTPPDATIGILGLSFKPGSDDVRMTPARDIIERLRERGYHKILAYDPMAIDAFRREHALPIDYAASLDDVLDRADVVLVTTAWPEFRGSKRLASHPRLFDLRYCLAAPVQPAAGRPLPAYAC